MRILIAIGLCVALVALTACSKSANVTAGVKLINLAGIWRLEMSFPDKGISVMQLPDLNLKQTGATITGTTGDGRPVKGTIEGSNVTLTINFESLTRSGVDTVYNGQVVNTNTMQGTVTMIQLGPGTWKASRQSLGRGQP